MSVSIVDDGRLSGEKAYNADVDASADINPLKIEKNKIFLGWPSGAVSLTTATSSTSNAFIGYSFPDPGTSSIIFNLLSPRAEITPGEKATLHIWWTTAATSGSIQWVVDIKPVISGFTTLASALRRSVIAPAASANAFIDSRIDLPPAIFSNNQLIGLKISRDAGSSLDTIGAAAVIRLVYLEINGRC